VTLAREAHTVNKVNRWLDRLPRAAVYVGGREAPAFRAMGSLGVHVAAVCLLAGALLRGLPLVVAAALAVVALTSFFGWAWLRRALTGRERIVLFEHVWLAGVLVVGLLAAIGAPALTWLDVFAVTLCAFLAFGRIGCTLAGCCHGQPSAVGITYERLGDQPHPLSGVRLLPVQPIEAAGIAAIGCAGLAALPFASDGAVLVWVLGAYGVLRLGAEALRGDPRPAVIGFPVARTAAVAQVVAAVAIDQIIRGGPVDRTATIVAGVGLAVGALVGRRWTACRPGVGTHVVAEIRALVDEARPDPEEPVVARAVAAGVAAGVSIDSDHVHLSLSSDRVSPDGLAHLARAALGSRTELAHSASGVLHAACPVTPPGTPQPACSDAGSASRSFDAQPPRRADARTLPPNAADGSAYFTGAGLGTCDAGGDAAVTVV
jgi:hypothetical protein